MVRGYRGSFSRASSDSSEFTRGESDEVSSEEGEMTSTVYPAEKEKESTEWTDEKHSLYLKSMEASFIDQLYNSLGNLGSHCNMRSSTDVESSRQPCWKRNPSQEQFKVHRAGFWKRMDVKQSKYCFNRSGTCHEVLASPWVKHFRPLPAGQSPDSSTFEGRSDPVVVCPNGRSASSKQVGAAVFCLSNRDQINNREEVSDQNFADEETKQEKAGSSSSSKKMKMGMSESSSNDQVVPYGKAPST
ncbi:PREDICTED: uncharacterized protein LOC104822850 [Tarenaya hassleriana]|uniref:uncharacterized protein LOC104822850 n=1 Tax=Tarenaya hassleriana TaxID=28532 RepID=UPI00053C2402|nr:PREDICTED: uncharacterized protein LOC104822850 [Tarenaya hassleriana]